MDKPVRRATRAMSLAALAGSYAQACPSVLRLVASCIKGEVASIFHSSGYITLIVHYVRIYGNVNHPWPRGFALVLGGFTAINSDVVDNNYNIRMTIVVWIYLYVIVKRANIDLFQSTIAHLHKC